MFFSSNPNDLIFDAEAFYVEQGRAHPFTPTDNWESGWYFWFCQPGCLPDNDEPFGPFESKEEAIHACREMVND
jgi:hypothetical protein